MLEASSGRGRLMLHRTNDLTQVMSQGRAVIGGEFRFNEISQIGIDSMVTGSTPRNWQAKAVVPEPPKGSIQVRTGRRLS